MEEEDKNEIISSTSKTETSNKRAATDDCASSPKKLATEQNTSASPSLSDCSSSNKDAQQSSFVSSEGPSTSAAGSLSDIIPGPSSNPTEFKHIEPNEGHSSMNKQINLQIENKCDDSSETKVSPSSKEFDQSTCQNQAPFSSTDMMEIDFAEADTSFSEAIFSDKDCDPTASASSNLDLLEIQSTSFNRQESSARNENADHDEDNSQYLASDSNKFEKDNQEEEYSSIENALQSMISDVEQSNLEPLSLDSRDLSDFLNDKPEVSSSCEITFQADSFIVSSTSEDTINKASKDILEGPSQYQHAVSAVISNSVVSNSSQTTQNEVSLNGDKAKEELNISRSLPDSASGVSMLYNELTKNTENICNQDTVSTTSKEAEINFSKNKTLEQLEKEIADAHLTKESSAEVQKEGGRISIEKADISSSKTLSPEFLSTKGNDEIDIAIALKENPIPAEETAQKNFNLDQNKAASIDQGSKTKGETSEKCSSNLEEENVEFGSFTQRKEHEAKEMEDSTFTSPDDTLETDNNIDFTNDDSLGKIESAPASKLCKQPLTEKEASLDTPPPSYEISLENTNNTNKPTTASILPPDVDASKETPLFAEPLKKVSSEYMETECADSSTVVSAGSGDNFDSFAATPCDSGETSPSLSTPAGSCQVSAAPSPLSKPIEEEQNLVSSLFNDNSMDSKFIDDDSREIVLPSDKKPSKTPGKKEKKIIKRKGPVILDEETRMDAGGNGAPDFPMDEDSQGSLSATSKKKVRSFRCEVIVPESTEIFTADKVAEYMWPLEGFGEHYFIQEHISQYLGIMSFKRRYPDLRRRPIESQEKEYLKESGFVNEMACDLGLMAVRSEDVFDVMFNDFPSKYEELQRVLREKKERHFKEKGKVEYQMMNLDKSKLQEYGKKAAQDAARWNISFNRDRREERRYAFDLQTFTVHKPISSCKKLSPEMTKINFYPVAVLPGQYTDVFRQYSSVELKSMPLQTVLCGPFTAEELNTDASANVSEDESAPASVGTCSNEKEVIGEKEPEAMDSEASGKALLLRCKECSGTKEKNKHGKPEPLIICGSCRAPSHPTCIELTLSMVGKIESYSWQCMECKTCAQCNDPDDEERMIFCDMCDRGYHIYCVGLRRVPQGRWHCKECAICFSCGSKTPSGNEHIKNAEWQHEYKKEKDVKQLKYACTLCMPCDRYWKRRQFCYICMKVYRSIPEDGMVKCTGCPKYVHREGCSTIQDNERYCTSCFKTRNKTALNHSRIIAAAKKKMASGY